MLKAARLFGTNGIRAVAGDILNADFAYRIGSSVASLFEAKRILVGCDGRTSSPMLTEGVVAGLLDVWERTGRISGASAPPVTAPDELRWGSGRRGARE